MTDRYDAIVILGAWTLPDGSPSAALARRVRHGVALYRQGLAPRLLLTGGAVNGPLTEARVMARLARELGMDPARLVLEETARNTLENARYSQPLLARLGCRRLLVVSDGYHLPRALLTFRALGMDARGSSPPPQPQGRSLYLLAREALALGWYALRLGWWRLFSPRTLP